MATFSIAADFAQQVDHLLLVRRVDVGGRLVGQQQQRPIHQGPGHGDALLLADREGGRLVRQSMAEADALEQILGARCVSRRWPVKVMPNSTFSSAENPASRLNV